MKKVVSILIYFLFLYNIALADTNSQSFVDVSNEYWAKNEIEYFASQDIVEGVGEDKFLPEEGVTREQFAKMLVLTFQAPLTTPSDPSFADVSKDRWSYSYIEVCKDFLTGYSNPFGGKPAFHPEEYATREEIAVALVRVMGLSDKDVSSVNYAKKQFSDAGDISPNLLGYVSLATERGLIRGYPDKTFGPTKSITRAEAVVLLNRVTRQAVTNLGNELDLWSRLVYGANGDEVTVIVQAEEGIKVTIDGQTVVMSKNGYGKYEGAYLYKFEETGNKTFKVEGVKAGKSKSIDVIANYELQKPVILITQCPEYSQYKSVTISGSIKDSKNNKANLVINSKQVYVNYNGTWEKNIDLEEGENIIEIVATNALGQSTNEMRTISFNPDAPALTITLCPDTSGEKNVTIKGVVKDINDKKPMLTINQKEVSVNYNGNWEATLSLVEGENEFEFVAKNSLGKSMKIERVITFEVGTPEIMFTNCPEITNQNSISIQGSLKGYLDGIKFYMNDQEMDLGNKSEFSKKVTLSEGDNTFVFRAINSFGKEISVVKSIKYTEITAPLLTVNEAPQETKEKTITLSGQVNDMLDSTVNVLTNDKVVKTGNGEWNTKVTLNEGTNEIIITAVNKFGKTTTVIKKIIYTVPSQ